MQKNNFVRNLTTSALLVALSIILSRMLSIFLMPSLKLSFAGIPLIMIGMYYGPFYGAIGGIVADLVGFSINPAGGAYIPGLTISTMAVGLVPGLIYYYFHKKKSTKNYAFLNSFIILAFISGIALFFVFFTNVITYSQGHVLIRGNQADNFLILFIIALILYAIIPIILNKMLNKNMEGVYSLDKIVFTVSITYIISSIVLNAIFISQAFGTPYEVTVGLRLITNFFNIPIHALIVYSITMVLKKAKLIN